MKIIFKFVFKTPFNNYQHNYKTVKLLNLKTIAVLGLGKVGSLVAELLSNDFSVIGIDRNKTIPVGISKSISYHNIDISDVESLETFLSDNKVEAVVSCLSYYLNKSIVTLCVDKSIHYFDLTEDVETTNYIKEISKNATSLTVPQCGLAPGIIGIIGYDLTRKFTKLRSLKLKVGALPQNPNGLLGYSFNWSPAGVLNEYIQDAEVIHNSKRKMVPSLEFQEKVEINGKEFESFSTSGGLGSLCEILEGKVDTLDYKTIRYPGHAKIMRFLLNELLLKNDRDTAEKILTNAKPPVKEDVVYIHAIAEGYKNNKLEREEFVKAYTPKIINSQRWRAISWTTACSITAIIHLASKGAFGTRGFVKQEDVYLKDFLETPTGQYFK